MKEITTETIAGTLCLQIKDDANWNGTLTKKVIADGVEEVTFSLSAETETIPAPVVIRLPIPQKDIFCRWTTSLPGVENICPTRGGCFHQ